MNELDEYVKNVNERIDKLEKQNKEKQDKLDKIEKYIKGHQLFGMRCGKTLYNDSLNNILKIIKGEDK